jgi:hypothetical protein
MSLPNAFVCQYCENPWDDTVMVECKKCSTQYCEDCVSVFFDERELDELEYCPFCSENKADIDEYIINIVEKFDEYLKDKKNKKYILRRLKSDVGKLF